jgi:threonine/homoserine/homoserine lactone efflux protein
MNVYEAIGVGWVIFTSLLATVGMVYFAYLGVKLSIEKRQSASANEIPDEVRKMFKIV